jgi:hypothetical protein
MASPSSSSAGKLQVRGRGGALLLQRARPRLRADRSCLVRNNFKGAHVDHDFAVDAIANLNIV